MRKDTMLIELKAALSRFRENHVVGDFYAGTTSGLKLANDIEALIAENKL